MGITLVRGGTSMVRLCYLLIAALSVFSITTIQSLLNPTMAFAQEGSVGPNAIKKIVVRVMNHEAEKELSGAQVSVVTSNGDLIPLFEVGEAGEYQNTLPIDDGFYKVVVSKIGFTQSQFNVEIASDKITELKSYLYANQ